MLYKVMSRGTIVSPPEGLSSSWPAARGVAHPESCQALTRSTCRSGRRTQAAPEAQISFMRRKTFEEYSSHLDRYEEAETAAVIGVCRSAAVFH